jgi:ribosomal protein S18 acetylase RimI-like enzyme
MSEIAFADGTPELGADELNELYTAVGWNQQGQRTPARTAEMLETSAFYATARHDGLLVGFGRMIEDPYISQVLDIITHPDYRRRGIASEIMRRMANRARSCGRDTFLIDGTAIAGINGFYERFGFQAAGASVARVMYFNDDEPPKPS